jgi:hypothetical protein
MESKTPTVQDQVDEWVQEAKEEALKMKLLELNLKEVKTHAKRLSQN